MKMHYPRWKTVAAVFCLCAAFAVRAQQQGGGFGGGGFGGGGFGNQARSGQAQYNPAGGVGNATITVDPDTQNVTVIADEETTRYIAEVIANLDRPQPQVLIKVVFLEVTHNDTSDIGIEGSYGRNLGGSFLSGLATNFTVISNTIVPASIFTPTNQMRFGAANAFGLAAAGANPVPPGAGLYSILGEDFQVTLRAIAQAGKAELLSRPSVLARNNQPATIVIGQSVPLITNVRFDTFGNAINSVTYRDVGIILRVTPFITSDGLVQMIVQPQTSSLDPTLTIPISAGVNAPVINVRSADTVVITPNGQTVVIGGLMQNSKSSSDSKIPLLGDIPLIGNLFKSRSKAGRKTELLIFLTPHVMSAPSDLAALTDKERNHSLTPKSYSEDQLDRFLEKVPAKVENSPSTRKRK